MMDISDTLQAKSDQLNADDLVQPITVKVLAVSKTSTDQPITIKYEGDNGRPFKPCKTVRRILAKAWGRDASQWTGRLMTLYNEPSVKWAGKDVGGIRVSHLSHIDGILEVNLSATRGAKQIHRIKPIAGNAQTQGAPAQANPPAQANNAPPQTENAPNIRLIKTDGSDLKFDNFQAWLDMIGANLPRMENLERLQNFEQNHTSIFNELEAAGWGEWVNKARAIVNENHARLGGNTDGEL
jgi:hypothetical protein